MGRRMVRFESTSTTKAADAAKQATSQASSTASEVSSKATQGLSRVTSAAGPAIANAAKGVSGALSRVGGRTGRLVAFVERKQITYPPAPSLALLPTEHTSRGGWLIPARRRGVVQGLPNVPMQHTQLDLTSWLQWLTVSSLAGQTPLVTYYSKVALEMAKLVVRGQNMSPP